MPQDKKTIMVVEDDPLSMKLAVDLLEMNGFRAVACADGEKALEALKDTIPALILLDIGMPKMNGFELYKKIREEKGMKQVKIFALSASVMKEEVERIKQAGFDDFIPKPVDIKSFVKKIKDYLSV